MDIKTNPGDVLISLGDAVPDLHALAQRFDVLDFLNLCSLIETVILHERLICVGPNPAEGARPIVAPLVDNGILHAFDLVSPDRVGSSLDIVDHPKCRQLISFLSRPFDPQDQDLAREIAARTLWTLSLDVVLEDKLQIPLALSSRSVPLYVAVNFNSDEQRATRRLRGSLAGIYGQMSKELISRIVSFEDEPVLAIPPLALEVLAATERLDALMDILLATRLDYEKLRGRIREIDATLRDQSLSYAERFTAERRLLRAVRELLPDCKPEEMTYFTETDQKLVEAVKSELKDGALSLSALDLTKVAGVFIKLAEHGFWKSRMGPLHATRRRYLEYSRKQVNEITERLFRHTLTEADISRAAGYEAAIARWKGEAQETSRNP